MNSWSRLLAGLPFFLISNTYAYSLSDHAEITRAAGSTLQECFDSAPSDASVELLVESNQWEDRNVLRKWFGFSHFYSPEREFRSLRLTSRDRILDLQRQLADPRRHQDEELLGKALHHLQDMTVPPHIIPVNHLWTDGFESLEVPVEPRLEFESCAALLEAAANTSLEQVHQQLAEETWKTVHQGSIPVMRSSGIAQMFAMPLTVFWNTGTDGDWGRYGEVGNAFGAEELVYAGSSFQVKPKAYQAVKGARLQSALRATQLVLAKFWILGLR